MQHKQLIRALNQDSDVEIAGNSKCLDHTIPIVALLVDDTVTVSVNHGHWYSESKHYCSQSVVDVSRFAQHSIYQYVEGRGALFMKSIYCIANREPN